MGQELQKAESFKIKEKLRLTLNVIKSQEIYRVHGGPTSTPQVKASISLTSLDPACTYKGVTFGCPTSLDFLLLAFLSLECPLKLNKLAGNTGRICGLDNLENLLRNYQVFSWIFWGYVCVFLENFIERFGETALNFWGIFMDCVKFILKSLGIKLGI